MAYMAYDSRTYFPELFFAHLMHSRLCLSMLVEHASNCRLIHTPIGENASNPLLISRSIV